MSKYLLKWKDQYRCQAIYDIDTGLFLRNSDAEKTLVDEDIFIPCAGNDMIYDYDSGKSILIAHFNSRQRGRRIVQELLGEEQSKLISTYKDGIYSYFDYSKVNDLDLMIYEIQENDKELWFKFNGNKNLHIIAKKMKPKKPMSSKTAYNSKYLPSHQEKLDKNNATKKTYKTYVTPKDYYKIMQKEILPKISKARKIKINESLNLCYEKFGEFKNINFVDQAEIDNYKTNHYIHRLKMWDEFVKFSSSIE